MKLLLPHKLTSLFVMAICCCYPMHAQVTASLTTQVAPPASQKTLKDFLASLEKTFKVYFTFESAIVRDKKVSNELMVSNNLEETLERALTPLNLKFEKVSDKYYSIFNVNGKQTFTAEESGDLVQTTTADLTAAIEGGALSSSAVIRVSGTITDENGSPMPGVNIVEKSTTNGVVTDTDGKFALDVRNQESILVISFVGYLPVEETVGTRTELSVQLTPDIATLSEVVVVAYGTQNKKDLTASVSTIKPDQIQNRPVTNIYQALQGLAPNLTIQQNNAEPGSVQTLNIRGVGSFTSNTPLIMIDGISVSEVGLNNLNPNDIENISILKDAASSAIYGSQAANGVIYITTKRGNKSDQVSVQYSGLFGLQSPTTSPQAVEAWEFMTLKNEALVNSGASPQFRPEEIRAARENGSEPWAYDEMVNNTVPQLNQNISVTGGTKNTSYLLSAGYLNQQSMFNNDYVSKANRFYYKRYNLRSNISVQINKFVKADLNLAYTNGVTRKHPFSTGILIRDAMRTPRIYQIKDDNGNFVVPGQTSNSVFASLSQGGYKMLRSNDLLGGLNVVVTPVENLVVNVNTSGNFSIYNEETQIKKFEYAPEYRASSAPPLNNEQAKSNWNDLTRVFFSTIEYSKTIGNHFGKILFGYRNDFEGKGSFVGARRFNGNVLDDDYMSGGDFRYLNGEVDLGVDAYNGMSNPRRKVVNSVFGRLNYTYADKYLAEFTWRYDGASVLAPHNRWFFFPAFSLGWRATDETFLESVKNNFGDIKFRYSWGQVGNSNIGGFEYISLVRFTPGQYSFNNTGMQGATFTPINPDLDWERSTMSNYGVDVDLIGGKLTASFDFFNKITKGIYFRPSVPGTLGQSSPLQNYAEVQNIGWEAVVSYRATTGEIQHTISANMSDNMNKILKMGEAQIQGADFSFINKEGHPISAYYLLKSDGLYQNMDDIENAPEVPFAGNLQVKPGDIRYVDKNSDGKIDETNDRYILDTPFPRFTFGVMYNATWKNFDFQMFWQGVGQRAQYLRGDIVEAFHNNEEHLYITHKDRWTPTNPDASYPRLTTSTTEAKNNTAYSDYWLYDTKYARLKNLQIGYTLPASLSNRFGMQSFRVYFSGQNLLTIAPERFRKLGMDPEFTQFDNKLSFSNYDPVAGRNYPNAKVLSVGVDIKF
ncbi:SusC/RagA family TonB-linked outer membrane protein [Pseudochryseolinea flava]|uniref:SusC/RagA family TonB-linked outer membrane protein n=1 Tax=Pseudochryseolinea flava TaxID=2059302 RepID=A0A364XY87_9BACT|nr:TonB-dependent receptor [Pseudochryseolinea flava]RAV99217.1 SusC/RagA family TonB-linked outer membrane protein [Pseudochryseolinea flava]